MSLKAKLRRERQREISRDVREIRVSTTDKHVRTIQTCITVLCPIFHTDFNVLPSSNSSTGTHSVLVIALSAAHFFPNWHQNQLFAPDSIV